MNLNRAKQFLENVCTFKEIVPFTRYRYGVGRKAQIKNKNTTTGRWPIKSAKSILKVLRNAESTAYEKGLDVSTLYIKSVQINKAVRGNRRTFRAHGRVNAFLSHPCHIEIWLVERFKSIEKSFL